MSKRSKRRRRAKLAKLARRRRPAEGEPKLPAAALLGDIAYYLNMAEVSGVTVELAHGSVITDWGYVFLLGDRAGERWQVRTRLLTEFPVPPGDD